MGGIYRGASEHLVLRVDVLETRKMVKSEDFSEFDTGHVAMARRRQAP